VVKSTLAFKTSISKFVRTAALHFKVAMSIVGRATLKMLGRKSKTQFVKQECNTQNAIALLN
jgi:hypothetical protein